MKKEVRALEKNLLHQPGKPWKIGEHPLFFGKRSKKGFREARVKGFPYLIIYKIYARKKIIFINIIHHTSRHPRRKYRK